MRRASGSPESPVSPFLLPFSFNLFSPFSFFSLKSVNRPAGRLKNHLDPLTLSFFPFFPTTRLFNARSTRWRDLGDL
jgi:hypothetical protein